jgi:hypothetical protein
MKIGVFVGFSRIFLLGILIFKELTARRLYKSFGGKGLIKHNNLFVYTWKMQHQKKNYVYWRIILK